MIYIYTRFLGRFAPIFYLNCEHVLFVYILKQSRKNLRIFKKKFADFQEFFFFTKLKTFKTHWIQTNKQTDTQTDRQAKFIDRLVENP